MNDNENTQPPPENNPAADINALSVAQLEELMGDLSPDDALRPLLETVLGQRRRAERKSTAKKTTATAATPALRTKRGRKLRAGEPGDRAIAAAQTFNGEPAKVAVWREALAEATDPTTGEIVLTGRIVQLGINAYFAQRKIDDAAKKAAAQQATAATDDTESLEVELPAESAEGPVAPTIEDEQGEAESAQPEAPFVSVTELPGLAMLSTPEGAALLTDLPPEMLSGLFSDDSDGDGGLWDE